jgi:hypothetical protein
VVAVWGHAGQDRGATLASWLGGRLVDAAFGDEEGMGGQGVGIIGWKSRQFKAAEASGEVEQVASVLAEGSIAKTRPGD